MIMFEREYIEKLFTTGPKLKAQGYQSQINKSQRMLVYERSPPPFTEQVTVINCLKVLPPPLTENPVHLRMYKVYPGE